MASRKEKTRILSGSLNLIAPGDKIPEADSLILDNWRVDQLGCLRSRKGSTREANGIGSGRFHTLARYANERYAGIGSSLYAGTALASTVTGGFDGEPLGYAFYRGSAWWMNRSKQIRTGGGSAFSPWGVAAPASAPTATAGGQNYAVLEDYEDPGTGFPASMDVGYFDPISKTYKAFPQSYTSVDAGLFPTKTVALVNGSPDVVGDGTSFSAPMIGDVLGVNAVLAGALIQWSSLITAVADGTHLTVADPYPYDTASLLQYSINSYSNAVLYDSSDKRVGTSSVKIINNLSAVTWAAANYFTAVDTRTSGVAQDDDVFRIWVGASDQTAVDSITITLVSGGTITNAGPAAAAKTASVVITGRALNAAPGAWTQLEILRTLDTDQWQTDIANAADTDRSAEIQAQYDARRFRPRLTEIRGGARLTGMFDSTEPENASEPATTEINWSAVTGIQVLVKLNSACTVHLDQAEFVGVIGGGLSGDLTYYVSYVRAIAGLVFDGNPSPAVNVSVKQQSVSLASIPVSADATVTDRWIYRIGGGLNQPLLVHQMGNNTSTTWVDTVDNTTAQNDNNVMPVNRTLPPAARGAIGPYFGKIIAFNTDAHPARIFWTPAAQPWYFPGADDEAEGNWEDAGNDDDEIIAATNHKRVLVLYKARSIWRLVGDPVSSDPEQTNAAVGLVGRAAVVNGGSADFFVGPQGVYRFDMDFETKISGIIDPIFKADFVFLASGEYLPPISQTYISTCVLELVNDRLYFSYPEEGQTQPNVTLVYHTESGRWARIRTGYTAMHYEGTGRYLMGGVTSGGSGSLYRLEDGVDDNGSAIHLVWQSRYSDQGLSDNLKRYEDLEIDFQTAQGAESASTLTVYAVYDNGTKVSVGTISSATRTTTIFQLLYGGKIGYPGKNFAVRVEGDATSTCIIHGVYLHWYPEERTAKSFDSGHMNSERVRQVDYLELEMTGDGNAFSYALSSDLPGSVVTERTATTATQPNGRGNSRFRLGSVVEGRTLRLTLGSASHPFQLHKARMRQREIGEYIDGTLSEYWLSPEFSVSPGRDGELKDLMLDYDSSGAGGILTVYSDLPGSAMTSRRTIAIPAGARRTYVFPFEDGSGNLPYGTLFRLRIDPPAGGILRLHGRATIRARIIGVSFDGGEGERFETQALDLVNGIGEFREIALIAQTGGEATAFFLTELPGTAGLTVRSQLTFDTGNVRKPVYFRMPGGTKGTLQALRITGESTVRLFEAKVYGRLLGGNPTNWMWIPFPIETTPDAWATIQAPVRATADQFTWIDIDVDSIE